eukprot:PhF_6_TR5185/c3_g1_i1/m.7458
MQKPNSCSIDGSSVTSSSPSDGIYDCPSNASPSCSVSTAPLQPYDGDHSDITNNVGPSCWAAKHNTNNRFSFSISNTTGLSCTSVFVFLKLFVFGFLLVIKPEKENGNAKESK